MISICIPAYKKPDKIRRLLKSISEQTFKDYEVIVSDDSPDNCVQEVIDEFGHLQIVYYKNKIPLGTPTNWNFAISKAKREWIKIMHDDDWFVNERSLMRFAEETKRTSNVFIFSGYCNVYERGGKRRVLLPLGWGRKIIKNPVSLLARNVIGPPSVTLVHRKVAEQYDDRLKWRVDIEYYIRLLKKFNSFDVINETLVNVEISHTQVTNDCINIPEVELPEGLILLQKHGVESLKYLLTYDAWWRILRNVGIRKVEQLLFFTQNNYWPAPIIKMVKHQQNIHPQLLKIGIVSKFFMFASYLLNRKYLHD